MWIPSNNWTPYSIIFTPGVHILWTGGGGAIKGGAIFFGDRPPTRPIPPSEVKFLVYCPQKILHYLFNILSVEVTNQHTNQEARVLSRNVGFGEKGGMNVVSSSSHGHLLEPFKTSNTGKCLAFCCHKYVRNKLGCCH